MTESSSFTSLMALVDSHLSKTSLQADNSNNVSRLLTQPGSQSDTGLFQPRQRLPIPSFNLSESPIQSILSEQVANMLRTQEQKKKEEEEKQRLAEEMKRMKLEEDEFVIDLTQALQTSCGPGPPKEQSLSSSSSCESLFQPKFNDSDITEEKKPSESILPCKTDMSYILFEKVRRGKCSAFGKVLTARVRPVAAPYLREKIKSSVVPFDFSTPSPDDILKEKQKRKPTISQQFVPDIINFI